MMPIFRYSDPRGVVHFGLLHGDGSRERLTGDDPFGPEGLAALRPSGEAAQLARLLPAGAVLVEFQRYQSFDGRQKQGQQWGDPRYLALVLTPAGSTRAVDLGPAAAIDRLIAEALRQSEASGTDPTTL